MAHSGHRSPGRTPWPPASGPATSSASSSGATFPAQVDYENVIIEDLLPPGYAYVAGSAARVTSIDDFPGATFTPGNLRWSLGTVDNAGRDFRWVIAVRVGVPDDGVAGDIDANLQKMIHNQNGGIVFQYRDEAPAEWTEPEVDLVKGVKAVDAADNSLDRSGRGPDWDGSATGGSTGTEVQSEADVTFRVDVTNDGNKPALNVEVWDRLPAGITCARRVRHHQRRVLRHRASITWVTASIAAGSVVEHNYVVTMPIDVPRRRDLDEHRRCPPYEADTNDGTYDYYPRNNIDPTVTSGGFENTDRGRRSGVPVHRSTLGGEGAGLGHRARPATARTAPRRRARPGHDRRDRAVRADA